MNKVQCLYYDACKEALMNSRQWLEEANYLLYHKNSFGHSLSLTLFSIEESMKAWICFSVGIGAVEHTEDIVKEVFRSHESKMADAILLWLMMRIPDLIKPYSDELNDKELAKLGTFYDRFDPTYVKMVETLVDYRKSGIYVDVKERKIISPSKFTKSEAEGFIMDAMGFVRFMEFIVDSYESADEDTKKSMLDSIGEGIRQGVINFNRMTKESEN